MDVVLDTALLLLLVAGRTDRRIIRAHRRLQRYDVSDYDLLLRLIEPFAAMILTPNIATETSNLAGQTAEPDRTLLRQTLSIVAGENSERYVPSRVAAQQDGYSRLGMTDAAILVVLEHNATLLTADAGLHIAALYRGRSSLNFFHCKDAG